MKLSAQGIEFFHGTYEESLAKAANENKNIFVDVYTSWCGPCKKMAAEVFTDKRVGDFFNANFVCLKLDAEQEAGHGFFEHYKASAYPSYFWLDADGQLLGNATGYQDAEPFIRTAQQAILSRTGERLIRLRDKWDSGERDAGFVKEYISQLSKVRPDEVRPIVTEYVSSLTAEEVLSHEVFGIISGFMRNISNDPIALTLLKNAHIYRNYDGNRNYNGKDIMVRYYRMAVRSVSALRDRPGEYAEALDIIRNSGSEYATMWLEVLALEKTLFVKDFAVGIPRMVELTEKYAGEHPYLYSQLLYTLVIADFFRTDTPDGLNETVEVYADRAMRLNPCQQNMLFLTSSIAKRGDCKRAYGLLASISFYPLPKLSNAVYKYLDLPVPKNIYPW